MHGIYSPRDYWVIYAVVGKFRPNRKQISIPLEQIFILMKHIPAHFEACIIMIVLMLQKNWLDTFTMERKIALQQKSFYLRQKIVFSNQLSITWEANSINTGNEFAFLRKHSEFI
jgi:hypothetical protein